MLKMINCEAPDLELNLEKQQKKNKKQSESENVIEPLTPEKTQFWKMHQNMNKNLRKENQIRNHMNKIKKQEEES